MKPGQILSVNKFNRLQLIKYHKDCANWDYRKGGFPQILFYTYDQTNGYVLITENGSEWAETKAEIINKRKKYEKSNAN